MDYGTFVRRARLEEMSYILNKRVWTFMKRNEAHRRGWKMIRTRWIDIHKGAVERPYYRCRFVAKEFNDIVAGGLFTALPLLMGLRIVSDAATVDSEDEGQCRSLMVNCVSRSFFEAPMTRKVCIELPKDSRRSRRRRGRTLLHGSLWDERRGCEFPEGGEEVCGELWVRRERVQPHNVLPADEEHHNPGARI